MTKHKLTVKQQRFIAIYDGNLTASAKKAGISVSYAKKIVSDSALLELIREREKERIKGPIATREERQEFWTKVLLGKDQEPEVISYNSNGNAVIVNVPPKMSDRLKASELLGRSEADFTDKKIISDPDGKSLRWTVEIVKSEGE